MQAQENIPEIIEKALESVQSFLKKQKVVEAELIAKQILKVDKSNLLI